MRITESSVKRLGIPATDKAGAKTQVFHRDEAIPGFGVRVTSGGAKSFIVERRINGKVRRHTIGRCGAVTVDTARKEAVRFLGTVASNLDPIAISKKKAVQSIRLGDAFENYLLVRKNLKPTTIHDYRRCIDGSLSDWCNLPLSSFTQEMVEVRHRVLGNKSHARANNTMRVLRAVFNHAIASSEDENGMPLLTLNPVDRLNKTRAWYKITPRQTYIKQHQLEAWFKATQKLSNRTTRDYLHLLILTGLRRSEASRLAWAHVDFASKTLTIPVTKNHRAHHLPLSPYVEQLLTRRHAERDGLYVFTSESDRGYLIEPKTAVAKVATICGVPFTLHDLRRTFITVAESLDVSGYALKRLLNHIDPNDVTASYIVSDVERLRKPMELISKRMLELAERTRVAQNDVVAKNCSR